MAKLAQMGVWGILFVHGSNAVFHFCTLEEYYVGGLFLPLGNAITDGSILYFAVMILLAICGNHIMVVECFSKDKLYQGSPPVTVIALVIAFAVVVQLFTVGASISNIFKHKRQIRAMAEAEEEARPLEPPMDGEKLVTKTLVYQVLAYVLL